MAEAGAINEEVCDAPDRGHKYHSNDAVEDITPSSLFRLGVGDVDDKKSNNVKNKDQESDGKEEGDNGVVEEVDHSLAHAQDILLRQSNAGDPHYKCQNSYIFHTLIIPHQFLKNADVVDIDFI